MALMGLFGPIVSIGIVYIYCYVSMYVCMYELHNTPRLRMSDNTNFEFKKLNTFYGQLLLFLTIQIVMMIDLG